MVIKANIQKNPALGVDLKQGGGQSVTNENIINALGYTPANEADIPTKVSQLENDEKYVKSWEDLPDKPFYIEETISSVTETLFEHEILDSASVPLSGVFYRYNFAENLNLNIEENVKYTLIVNGVKHESSEIDTHNKTLSFANVQIGSLSTTLSIIQSADKTQIAYRVGSYGTYLLDVSLYSNEETQIVHPLPEMFLPVHSHEWHDLPLTDDDKIPAIYLPETMGPGGGGMTEEQAQQLAKNTEDISKISEEIDDLKVGVDKDTITEAVNNYLVANPVTGGTGMPVELKTALKTYFTNMQTLITQLAYTDENHIGSTLIANAKEIVTALDLIAVTVSQSGTRLILNGVEEITSITQSGSTLVLA